MDNVDTHHQLIKTALQEYTRVPYVHGDIQKQVALAQPNHHYLITVCISQGIFDW